MLGRITRVQLRFKWETSLSGNNRTAAACAMRREPPVEIVGVAEVVARVMVGALEVQ